ncbi:MAG TPA: hypothetical protein VJM50_07665 [Pyrinomonadaceae bacterium]|nr:hypothetical protein [Pyrinomonadaceae bacterium]
MFKKTFCLVVICSIMIVTSGRVALAANATAKEAAHIEKVKAAIAKLGTGPSAQVEIKLRDKSKLRGYIKEANEEHFVLVSSATGSDMEVAYPQVKGVKGNNLSTGAKVAIGVGVGIVILLLVFKDRINGH